MGSFLFGRFADLRHSCLLVRGGRAIKFKLVRARLNNPLLERRFPRPLRTRKNPPRPISTTTMPAARWNMHCKTTGRCKRSSPTTSPTRTRQATSVRRCCLSIMITRMNSMPAWRTHRANPRRAGSPWARAAGLPARESTFAKAACGAPGARGTWPSWAKVSFRSRTRRARSTICRAGRFCLNANGQVVVEAADSGRLLEPAITVPNDATHVAISAKGAISWRIPSSAVLQQSGTIQLVRFINPQGMRRIGGNLYVETSTAAALRRLAIPASTAWARFAKARSKNRTSISPMKSPSGTACGESAASCGSF